MAFDTIEGAPPITPSEIVTAKLIKAIKVFVDIEGDFHMIVPHFTNDAAKRELRRQFPSPDYSISFVSAASSPHGAIFFVHVTKERTNSDPSVLKTEGD